MSVLDELDIFWEKTDASRGISPLTVRAEHIMEKKQTGRDQGAV